MHISRKDAPTNQHRPFANSDSDLEQVLHMNLIDPFPFQLSMTNKSESWQNYQILRLAPISCPIVDFFVTNIHLDAFYQLST